MTSRVSPVFSVPVTELDSQMADLIRTVHERREPVVLTRDGCRLAVVLSPEAFDALEAKAESLHLQRAVEEAEREVAEGKAVPHEEVSAELDRWMVDED